MIHHVVLWTFREEAQGAAKTENLRAAKAALDSLVGKVPEIRTFLVGVDIVRSEHSYDLALVSTFDTLADLRSYQAHPAHQEVATFLRTLHNGRVTADFEQ